MGILFNNNVEETKIMSAYGLTVYGKVNVYEWTIYNNESENALITFRVVDNNGDDVINLHMGNRYIFKSVLDATLDNFLYWIATEKPDAHTIEDQIYKSLCESNCVFNTYIRNQKAKAKQKREEAMRVAENQKRRHALEKEIIAYCDKKGYFYFNDWDEVIILEAKTKRGKVEFENSKNDIDKMRKLIEFIQKYPENLDGRIVVQGNIDNILNDLR